MLYSEEMPTRTEALRREKYSKTGSLCRKCQTKIFRRCSHCRDIEDFSQENLGNELPCIKRHHRLYERIAVVRIFDQIKQFGEP